MYKPMPYRSRSSTPQAQVAGVGDFLQRHRRIAGLLPQAGNMLALQAECRRLLPPMFACCEVVRFDSGLLVIHLPSSALLSKLKQQLPKLQEQLAQRGWQVTAIRLKVQVSQPPAPSPVQASSTPRQLTPAALNALDDLAQQLQGDRNSQPLLQALQSLLASARQKHQGD